MNGKAVPTKAQQGLNNGKSHRCVLGPVAKLEDHVPPDWWRGIFNSLYLKTDSDVVDDMEITCQEVAQFAELMNLSPDTRILDLCCGQGRHSIELAHRGYLNVEGFDRSHFLIQKARQTSRKEGLPLRFREGDARKLPYAPDTFDVIMILGNSFGYFETAHEDLEVLHQVFRVLKPWGKLLVDVSDGEYLRENFEARSWEWLDEKHFVCRERALSDDGQRLISREVVTHGGRGVIADQFYAERLYSREGLTEVLRSVGFSDIAIHGEIATDSRRNQDLGMMARRIILSAVVRKEWSPVRKHPKKTMRSVAVLMGDPSKLDPLKPDSVFDDDDIYTIDRMKDALRQIPGYQFSFLTNHDSMMNDIAKLKGKVDFVFNICDEGFVNDPFMELHIPALLEMVGIPYTGAGPQCLAYCYDKSLIRGIAKEMDIPIPDAFFVKPDDRTFDVPFPFPMILKPNFGDSSFGITKNSVVHDIEGILNEVTRLHSRFGYEKPILVEEFLPGKDLTVGIIGNPGGAYTVYPICEEDYSDLPEDFPRICGYEAKWAPHSPYACLRSVQAELPEEIEKFMVEACLKLYERLGCRDYARFDWRLDAMGNPKLLEVNPNPGWCWDGHLAKMAAFAGTSYPEMLEAILRTVEQRLGLEPVGVPNEEAVTAMSGNGLP